jgi:hypothetical protein
MPNLAESLTEEALILRLRSAEHDFVERKPRNQQGDWLQTAVAFANSAPIGYPAVLYVGVSDDGEPQQNVDQLENLGKSVSAAIEKAYPAIYRHTVPLHFPDGRGCLAVVIPGSELRPHFAGRSYIRDGPQTKEASEDQFSIFIAERNSKARELLKWRGKDIEVRTFYANGSSTPGSDVIKERTQFYLLLTNNSLAIPLERVSISYNDSRKALMLEIKSPMWQS